MPIERIRHAVYRLRTRAAGHLFAMLLSAVRLFSPLRLLYLDVSRVAHMRGMANYYLRRCQQHPTKGESVDILICEGEPCNQTLFNMIRGQTRVVRSNLLSRLFHFAESARPGHPGLEAMVSVLHAPRLFAETDNPFALTPQQLTDGRRQLAAMGVPDQAPLVCFAVRDQAYLKARGDQDWEYHRYRNGDAEAYLAAVRHLCKKGFWGLRMGAAVERALDETDSRIIDYAAHHRTDFMDVYLGARCDMFIGDNSGIVHFAVAQGKGGVRANLGLGDMFSPWPEFLSVPMLYRSRADGELLSFAECIRKGFHLFARGDEFDAAGVDVVYTTGDEMIEAVDEWLAKRDGTWRPHPGDAELVARFYALYPDDFSQTRFPRPPVTDIASVSTTFLRRHSALLTESAKDGAEGLERIGEHS